MDRWENGVYTSYKLVVLVAVANLISASAWAADHQDTPLILQDPGVGIAASGLLILREGDILAIAVAGTGQPQTASCHIEANVYSDIGNLLLKHEFENSPGGFSSVYAEFALAAGKYSVIVNSRCPNPPLARSLVPTIAIVDPASGRTYIETLEIAHDGLVFGKH